VLRSPASLPCQLLFSPYRFPSIAKVESASPSAGRPHRLLRPSKFPAGFPGLESFSNPGNPARHYQPTERKLPLEGTGEHRYPVPHPYGLRHDSLPWREGRSDNTKKGSIRYPEPPDWSPPCPISLEVPVPISSLQGDDNEPADPRGTDAITNRAKANPPLTLISTHSSVTCLETSARRRPRTLRSSPPSLPS
jgi:hypothetical protein